MKFLNKLIRLKWLQHTVFWLLSVYAIGSYFSIAIAIFAFIDYFYAILFHIPLVVLVYVNLRLLVPKFLQKGKYLLYVLFVVADIALAYLVHEFTFEILLPVLPTEFYMVSFTEWQVLVNIFVIYLVLTTLLKLSKSWYALQQVEKKKVELELKSLKMQINPHFLFNSLNSIYAMALVKSDKTAASVLELSNLLRYMIYEVGDKRVSLEKEVEIIQGYLGLQRLRSDASTEVSFKIEGDLKGKMIAPLLFFPLIENSFKHGVKGVSDSAFVHMYLKCSNDQVDFSIVNNKGEIDDMEAGKFGGIGLQNVSSRLALIYPKKHTFKMEDEQDKFTVNLTIKL
ncbi:sensor histidine kinase [Roseivirga echinicomitans]